MDIEYPNTRSRVPPSEGIFKILYANTGGHPETIGPMIKGSSDCNLVIIAESKASMLNGTFSNFTVLNKDDQGQPPLRVLQNKKDGRGLISSIFSDQGDNKRPFFCGQVMINSERRVLVCACHLTSGNEQKATDEVKFMIKSIVEYSGVRHKGTDFLFIGDFNRADTRTAKLELETLFEGGGLAKWYLDRAYYVCSDNETSSLDIEAVETLPNTNDNLHVGIIVSISTGR